MIQKSIRYLIIPFILLLISCGGSDEAEVASGGGTNGGTIPNACSLISEADFAEVSPATSGISALDEVVEPAQFSSCTWETANSSQLIALTIWSTAGPLPTSLEALLGAQRLSPEDGTSVDSFGTNTILAGTPAAWIINWESQSDIAVSFGVIGVDIDEAGMIAIGAKIDQRLSP